MGQPVARIGDQQSHGGTAITGSQDVFVNGRPVHRQFDLCYCPQFYPATIIPHGVQPLITASGTVLVNSRGVGRIGDTYACGAIIIVGSQDVFAG